MATAALILAPQQHLESVVRKVSRRTPPILSAFDQQTGIEPEPESCRGLFGIKMLEDGSHVRAAPSQCRTALRRRALAISGVPSVTQ